MNLPYTGCLTSRSISTATVFCILVLTTRPVRVRAPLVSTLFCSALTSSLRRPSGRPHAARSSGARCSCAPSGIDPAWVPAPWRAACAGRIAPCASSATHPTTRRRTSSAALWLPSAHLPLHERGGHGELRAGQAERLASSDLIHAFHLEQHFAGLHARDVVLDVTFTATHTNFERLLADRHIREHPDPDLAATLHIAGHRATRGFDLTCRHTRAAGRLQAELAEGNIGAALRQAGIAAFELLTVLGAFWLEHGCLRSSVRPAPERQLRPLRVPRLQPQAGHRPRPLPAARPRPCQTLRL